MFHQAVSKNRLRCPAASRQIHDRSAIAGVGEDQRNPRVVARERERVRSQRRDPPAGVDDDRQPALVREVEDPADRGIVEPEPLRARMQLDPRRAATDRALELPDRAAVGIDTAERDQPALGGLRRSERPVVGCPIAAGLGERKHDRAAVDDGERSRQLVNVEA